VRVIHREYDALLTCLSFEFKPGFKFLADIGLPVADYWSVGNPSADLIVPGPSCVDRTRKPVGRGGYRFSDVRPPVSISDEALCASCPPRGHTVLADLGFKM
jgi:hypothetical protein